MICALRSRGRPSRATCTLKGYSLHSGCRSNAALSIDLRSDTGTVPTEEMLRAMACAEAGDDARGECRITRALEERVAELTGKEAALFLPTCTMANNLVLLHHKSAYKSTSFACGRGSHLGQAEDFATKEMGQSPHVLNVTLDGLPDPTCVQRASQLGASLLCLENANWATGVAFPAVPSFPSSPGRSWRVHLDGARLWNAEAALSVSLPELCVGAHSVSLCFSKGLSAPGGAVICAESCTVAEMRVWRRTLGGAMRQITGQLAVAAAVAIDTRQIRLHEDHERSQKLRDGLSKLGGRILNDDIFTMKRATNVVLWHPDGDIPSIATTLARLGIRVRQLDGVFRFMLHRMITDVHLVRVLDACAFAVECAHRSEIGRAHV